ncbi:flagellar hook capping protein [Rhizobium sp. CRIBSB]|nr:flagellar hook capping protein [Rhizobium sp. CRIBSB]
MVDAVSTSTATNRINSGSAMLSSNFETFLSLLTTQLKNQDPLSPVDSNEFTAQLTQMAGVEQQLLTNDLLTSLLAGQQTGGLGGAANYIGKEATAAWSATRLTDGQATWSYELAGEATDVKVQVLDSTGKVVWEGAADDRTTGVHDFTWDGKTTAGGQLEDGGVYTLKVTATNGSGAAIDSQVLMRGRITGVELYNGEPYLTVGNSILPLSSVIALEEASAATAANNNTDDPDSLLSSVTSALNPLKMFS